MGAANSQPIGGSLKRRIPIVTRWLTSTELITQAPKQTPNAIVLALNAVKAALRSVIIAPVNVLDENDENFVTRILGVIGKPG